MSKRHNSNLSNFRKLIFTESYVSSISGNLVAPDCHNVDMYRNISGNSESQLLKVVK